jgi:hypothetical protein
MWFSLNFPFYEKTHGGFNGALYRWEDPAQLTVFGEFFRDYVAGIIFERDVVQASRDTYVDPARADAAFGDEGRLLLRSDHQGYAITSLLYFDLSSIPQDARILEASLRVRTVSRSNVQPLRVAIYPASDAWTEDITYRAWRDRRAPTSSEPTLVLDDVAALERVDVTRIVTRWLDGSLANHGLVLDTQIAGNTGNVCYDLAATEWTEGEERGPELWLQYAPR